MPLRTPSPDLNCLRSSSISFIGECDNIVIRCDFYVINLSVMSPNEQFFWWLSGPEFGEMKVVHNTEYNYLYLANRIEYLFNRN